MKFCKFVTTFDIQLDGLSMIHKDIGQVMSFRQKLCALLVMDNNGKSTYVSIHACTYETEFQMISHTDMQ